MNIRRKATDKVNGAWVCPFPNFCWQVDTAAAQRLLYGVPFYPLFPSPLAAFLALAAALAVMLSLVERAVGRNWLPPLAGRRLVHVATGMTLLLLPFIFEGPMVPLLTAAAFALLNGLSIRYGRLRGIHAIDRPSYGTVYFPLGYAAVVLLFWETDPVALQIAVLLVTIADAMAGWAGQRWGKKTFKLWSDAKSHTGAASMWITSALLAGIGLQVFLPLAGDIHWSATRMAIAIPLIATTATIAEAISRRGSDNLSVPLAGGVAVALITATPEAQLIPLALWVIGSALLLELARRLGSLEWSGMLSAWVMGNALYLSGGWPYLLPMIAFFISGSILSRIGTEKAHAARPRRDVRQVLANGGVPMALALAAAFSGIGGLYILYLGAIAAGTADTWATEIGKWSRSNPRSIIGWHAVETGTSGGITWLGTAGSLAGAAFIPLAAAASPPLLLSGAEVVLIVAAGFGAAVADSILGGTVQARYQHADGSISEDHRGIAGLPTVSGWSWLDNNAVNLIHTALAAWACWLAIYWMEL